MATLLLLAACSSPPPQAETAIDVEGLWLVTDTIGTFYGAEGPATFEFGPGLAGQAHYRSENSANGILDCERFDYAALAANVLLLNRVAYEAVSLSSSEIQLSDKNSSITLTRVTGPAPVASCLDLEPEEVVTFGSDHNGYTSLAAAGPNLYFNADDISNPVVGYDTSTQATIAPRTYGGDHDHLIAARTSDEFYGYCGCGSNRTLQRFDIGNPTPLVEINAPTDLGVDTSLTSGVFTGSQLFVAGQDALDANHLLELEPESLAMVSDSEVLPGTTIIDLAWTGERLAVLTWGNIVYLDSDGMAETTLTLPLNMGSFAGLTVVGDFFHLLGRNDTRNAVIYRAKIP